MALTGSIVGLCAGHQHHTLHATEAEAAAQCSRAAHTPIDRLTTAKCQPPSAVAAVVHGDRHGHPFMRPYGDPHPANLQRRQQQQQQQQQHGKIKR